MNGKSEFSPLQAAIMRMRTKNPPTPQQVEYRRYEDHNFRVLERRSDGTLLLKVGQRGKEIITKEVHESETSSANGGISVRNTEGFASCGLACRSR